jgi:serine/threonine protein kinase
MLIPILFLHFTFFAMASNRLSQLASSNEAIERFGDLIEKDDRVSKYEFNDILSENGAFGNVYLSNLRGNEEKELIIKVVVPADVTPADIMSTELMKTSDIDQYNPCWSYNEQKRISDASRFVFAPIETIPLFYGEEKKTYFCLIVMEKALTVFDRPLFDNKQAEAIVDNTKALLKYIWQIIEGISSIHKASYIHNDLKLSNVLMISEALDDPVINVPGVLQAEFKHIPYKAVINDFDVISNLKFDVKLENHCEIVTKITNNYKKLSEVINQLIGLNSDFIKYHDIMSQVETTIDEKIKEESEFFEREIKNQPKSRRRWQINRKQTFV